MIGNLLRALIGLLMACAFALAAFIAGYVVQQTSAPAPAAAVATPGPTRSPSAQSSAESDFAVFWEAWTIVKAEFIGTLPDAKKLTYGAIAGVVDTLGDQHTHFDEPERAEILQSDLNGSFEGIGATVDIKNNQIIVVDPLKGRPAEAAGVQSGDIILKIDGVATDGMSLTEAVARISGPKGTQVTLTIARTGSAQPLEITITRATIQVDVVTQRPLDNGLVYLQLTEFTAPSSKAVDDALQELMKSNPKGLVFDLRGNPGGFLSSAIEVGSEFVGDGLILSERDKDGNLTPHPALPGGRATKIPLVVLVDKGTASASEIVAGAIRDHGRGILVGEKTFGKGSVQVSDTLSDQSHLTITIRHWLTPKGTDIHGNGLDPDIPVPFNEADKKAGRDPQLERAIEFLLTGK